MAAAPMRSRMPATGAVCPPPSAEEPFRYLPDPDPRSGPESLVVPILSGAEDGHRVEDRLDNDDADDHPDHGSARCLLIFGGHELLIDAALPQQQEEGREKQPQCRSDSRGSEHSEMLGRQGLGQTTPATRAFERQRRCDDDPQSDENAVEDIQSDDGRHACHDGVEHHQNTDDDLAGIRADGSIGENGEQATAADKLIAGNGQVGDDNGMVPRTREVAL